MLILRMLMLLALVVWVGGIIFFAFVVAPSLFSMLPTPEMAGDVVRRDLIFLHLMGIASALVFLTCSLIYSRVKSGRLKPFALANLLVVLMLVLTLILQFRIMPRMDTFRRTIHATHDSASASYLAEQLSMTKEQAQATAQGEFDRLHQWSTRLEGGVLVLGIVVVGLTAKRFS
jgi:uncharacterized membrane protein